MTPFRRDKSEKAFQICWKKKTQSEMEAASRSTLPTLFTRLTLLVFNTVYTALQCKV